MHRLQPPSPELLPRLNQRLHLARTGKSAVHETAILESAFVELPHALGTDACKVVTKLLDLSFIEKVWLLVVGSASHRQR